MTLRINMWAGPRNISTTMMRSFENRPDTEVIDEPFYAYYLQETGAPHPMREACLAALPQTFDGVVEFLTQKASDAAPIMFHKQIAYHFLDDHHLPLDWLRDHRTFLLIRDPRAMVASYAQKFDDIAPITGSLNVQKRVFDYLTVLDKPCPIVDAADILKNPEGMLKALCAAIDIPFTDKMLSWPAGRRTSDGVWGPHWYDAVEQSTGFRPYVEKDISLSPALQKVADACAPGYAYLHERRLTA